MFNAYINRLKLRSYIVYILIIYYYIARQNKTIIICFKIDVKILLYTSLSSKL